MASGFPPGFSGQLQLIPPMERENSNSLSLRSIDESARTESVQHPYHQRLVLQVVSDTKFELAMGFIVILNIVVMIVETNRNVSPACTPETQDSHGSCGGEALFWINQVLLLVYTGEVLLRANAFGTRAFCCNAWNQLDLFVVVTGWIENVADLIAAQFATGSVEAMKFLKLLRLARLTRSIRLLRAFPQLYKMLVGLAVTAKAMFWGLVLIMFLLVLFALLTVQMPLVVGIDLAENDGNGQPLLNEYCQNAMQGVWPCIILFFQILIAGDSWGQCALPLIKMNPLMFVNFGVALIVIELGVTNLILSVIVESSQLVGVEDDDQGSADQRKAEDARTEKTESIIAQLDRRSRDEIIEHLYKDGIIDLFELDDEDINGLLHAIVGTHGSAEIQKRLNLLREMGQDLNGRCTLSFRVTVNSGHDVGYNGYGDAVFREDSSMAMLHNLRNQTPRWDDSSSSQVTSPSISHQKWETPRWEEYL